MGVTVGSAKKTFDEKLQHYAAGVRRRFPEEQYPGKAEEMIAAYKAKARVVNLMEEEVRQWMSDKGIPQVFRPYLMNVGREVQRLTTLYLGKTLEAEIKIVKHKWIARGLPSETVEQLAAFVLKRPWEKE